MLIILSSSIHKNNHDNFITLSFLIYHHFNYLCLVIYMVVFQIIIITLLLLLLIWLLIIQYHYHYYHYFLTLLFLFDYFDYVYLLISTVFFQITIILLLSFLSILLLFIQYHYHYYNFVITLSLFIYIIMITLIDWLIDWLTFETHAACGYSGRKIIPPEKLQSGVGSGGRRARAARLDAIRNASSRTELAHSGFVIHLHAGTARRALPPLGHRRKLHGRRDVISTDARSDPFVAHQGDVAFVTRRMNLRQWF